MSQSEEGRERRGRGGEGGGGEGSEEEGREARHRAAERRLRRQSTTNYSGQGIEMEGVGEGEGEITTAVANGMGGEGEGRRKGRKRSREEGEEDSEWVLVEAPSLSRPVLKKRMKKLAELKFPFPPPPRASPVHCTFQTPQGYRMRVAVSCYRDYAVITIDSQFDRTQTGWQWPVHMSFRIELTHSRGLCKSWVMDMEGECAGSGERCCSMEIQNSQLQNFTDSMNMVNIGLFYLD